MVTTNAPAILYNGNGVTTIFNAPWAQSSADIVVTTYILGIEYPKVLTTDYTIAGTAPTGLQVTFLAAPATGVEVIVYRVASRFNATDFSDARINPIDLNNKLDLLTELVQEIDNKANRSIKVPISESSAASITEAAYRKGMVVGFNSSTGAVELKAIPSVILGSSDITTALGFTPANVASITDERAMLDLLGNTRGSVIYRGASGYTARTPGTSGLPFVSNGAGNDPNYQALSANGLPVGMLPQQANRLPFTWVSTSSFTIGIGSISDSTYTDMMALLANTTKTTAAWVAGTGNGGKLSAAAMANNTWYAIYEIKIPGTTTTDIGFDTNLTTPTSTLISSYTLFRRIGYFLTDGSANILKTFQNTNTREFMFDVKKSNYNTNSPSTNRNLITVSAPIGTIGIFDIAYSNTSGAGNFLDLGYTGRTDSAASISNFVFQTPTTVGAVGGRFTALIDTSNQIFSRVSNASDTLTVLTEGWVDNL